MLFKFGYNVFIHTCCGELISGLSLLLLGGRGGGGGGGVGGNLGLMGSPIGRWGPGEAGLWGPELFDPATELWLAWLYLWGLKIYFISVNLKKIVLKSQPALLKSPKILCKTF